MVFSSAVFLLVFLPIVFTLNYFIKEKCSNYLLLVASLCFYAWGEPYLVLLMIFSIILNWGIGRLIDKTNGVPKKIILAAGVVCDLSVLIHYKYSAFFATIINTICKQEVFNVVQIALPIGISFFTFQAISYIVDVYRGDVETSKKIVNVALYISFFPQLIAGPIVKYRDINKQIEKREVSFVKTAEGFTRFIYGLAKKVLIANVLGNCVDHIFFFNVSIIDPKTAWIGAICYTFQIYYDFSGYSDMAIGLGKMFGFDILENFNYPYLSKSITEFWRRWHISLGSWFREYVYIPLGGNKKGKLRTYINLIIVFFLTGLWHGANATFIVWGLYHGFFQIIERIGLKKLLDKSHVISRVYSFVVVCIGWVMFRASDIKTGLTYISHMIMPWNYKGGELLASYYMDKKTLVMLACGVLGMGLIKLVEPKKLVNVFKGSFTEAVYCIALLILCLAAIASDTYNPFIYFQF